MIRLKNISGSGKNQVILYLFLVLAISYFTYFHNYENPPAAFWDENYHIASAEKYIQQVMFMENHPPLGKLFIALGEYLIQPNQRIDKADFIKTDFIKDFPQDYSFRGVRFFPALFGWLGAGLFFLILYLLSKNAHLAFAFSSLYVFENSFIVHFRGAMLESAQLFFILLAILYFVYLFEKEKGVKNYQYLILGLLIGLSVAVKINGAIIVALYPFLFFGKDCQMTVEGQKIFSILWQFIKKGLVVLAGIVLVWISIWQIHFVLGKNTADGNYYRATEEYKKIMENCTIWNPKNIFVIIRDNMEYSANYNNGVPIWDENGSRPLTWPLGGKPIVYRWEKVGDFIRYLLLEGNFASWLGGFLAVIFSVFLLVAFFTNRIKIKNQKKLLYLFYFLLLYLAYMAAMARIDRVMYLYHYFIPLLFSFFLLFILVNMGLAGLQGKARRIFQIAITAFIIFILVSYWFIAPVTYYQFLTKSGFDLRNWQRITVDWLGADPKN